MSLINASLVTAPTAIAPTGGTALAFASLGSPSLGKVSLYVPTDTTFTTRRSLDVTVKPSKANAASLNGYTQNRVTMIYKKPKVLASGKITVNTAKVELSFDIETTQLEVQELMDIGAQLLFDADTAPTFKTLSLA